MTPEERLQSLGLHLPDAPAPVGAYVPAVHVGALVFVSGQLPTSPHAPMPTGIVGRDLGVPEAQEAARQCAINLLAVVRRGLGTLDRVKRVVKIEGFVASAPGFTDQAGVVNGASELMTAVFGEAGRHARAAVGVSVLPKNAPVEIAAIFEVHD